MKVKTRSAFSFLNPLIPLFQYSIQKLITFFTAITIRLGLGR